MVLRTSTGFVKCFVLMLLSLLLTSSASARKANDVIPGLFGGDGIVLRDPSNGHAAIFTPPTNDQLNALSDAIGSQVGQFAVGAAVASFSFDPVQAVFMQTNESLGPLAAERAETIEKGTINFGLSYARSEFLKFEGDDLDDLTLNFAHARTCNNNFVEIEGSPGCVIDPDNRPIFELDGMVAKIDLELSQDVLNFFANYGLFENLDIGVLLPVVHTEIEANAEVTLQRNFGGSTNAHQFCTPTTPSGEQGCGTPFVNLSGSFNRDLGVLDNPFINPGGPAFQSSTARSRTSSDTWGVGDLLVRGKWNFLDTKDGAPVDMSWLSRIRFPTGDEDNFHGQGNYAFSNYLVMSRQLGWIAPHANFGLEFSTGGAEFDNFRYTVGADARVHKKVTIALDLIGLNAINKRDGLGDDLVDISAGAKVNVWKQVNLLASVLGPLNVNEGLRAITYGFGIEGNF
jgi:hypothetical protein